MIIVNSDKALNQHIAELKEAFNKHKYLRIDVKTGKQRSSSQNAALHVYCKLVADALNDAGLDFEQVFKHGYKVPWSDRIIKDHLWRPVQKAMFEHESTTKPLTTQYPKIYEYINGRLAEFGVHVPWPTKREVEENA